MRQPSSGISIRFGSWFDGGAVFASSLCLAHCLLLPIVVALSPTLAGMLDLGEGFHLWMVAIAIPISVTALIHGYRRHGRKGPGYAGGTGLALLAAGVLYAPSERIETLFTVAGSIILAMAHIRNWMHRNGAARKAIA